MQALFYQSPQGMSRALVRRKGRVMRSFCPTWMMSDERPLARLRSFTELPKREPISVRLSPRRTAYTASSASAGHAIVLAINVASNRSSPKRARQRPESDRLRRLEDAGRGGEI